LEEKHKVINGVKTRLIEINFLTKNIRQNKFIINRLRIFFFIATTTFVIYESIFSLSFNPIFFFLSILKFTLAFGIILFLGYLAIGERTSLVEINDKSKRKKHMIARMLLALRDIGIVLIILSTIFGIIHLTGLPLTIKENFQIENPGLEFPLDYQPTSLELVLIILIILLLLVSHFTLNYWFFARCIQYLGYNDEKQIFKIKISRALTGFLINALVIGVSLVFIFDDLFVATKFPDFLASWDKYDGVFTENAYIILIFELVLLVLLNTFYIIDGFLANKFRTNFLFSGKLNSDA